jgi:urease accessory protein
MLNINKLITGGKGLAPVLLKRAATLELSGELPQTGHLDTTDSQGRLLGIRLPQGTELRGGDVLVAEDGSLVRVIAAGGDSSGLTEATATLPARGRPIGIAVKPAAAPHVHGPGCGHGH